MSLEDLIIARYPSPEWAVVLELSGGVGCSGYNKRADAVAFNCWSLKKHLRIAFEIKRTRSDFMREIEDLDKRSWLEKHFHQTYFVTTNGLVKKDEIPKGWGLLAAKKTKGRLRRVKLPIHREIAEFPEYLAMSSIRSLSAQMVREREKYHTLHGQQITMDDIDEKVSEILSEKTEVLNRDRQVVRKLQFSLSDDRIRFKAPLNALARLSGLCSNDVEFMTADDVEKLVDLAVKRKLKGIEKQLRISNEAICEVLKDFPG